MWILDLTIDGICFMFLLLALAQPWRLPKVIRGAAINDNWFDSREHFRETCLTQCFFGIADAVTGMVFVLVLCSGLRTGNLCKKMCEPNGKTDATEYKETQFAGKWAAKTWAQFGHVLLDLIPFCFLVFYLMMPWRWPALVRGLRRHGGGWLFRTLCPCCTGSATDQRGPGAPSDSETRGRWIGQFSIGLLDAVTFLPYGIVLGTGLRAKKLCAKIEKVKGEYEEDDEYNYARATAVWAQFGSLLVDGIFVPLGLAVCLSGWRTSALLAVMADADLKGMKKRKKAIGEFGKMLVDIPYILMGGFVVLLAPWRWRAFFGELKLGDAAYAKTKCAPERREKAFEHVSAQLRTHRRPAAVARVRGPCERGATL